MRAGFVSIVCISVALALGSPGEVLAQNATSGQSFAKFEGQLRAVEDMLGQIERGKRITEKLDTSEALDALFAELKASYEPTMTGLIEEARKAEEAAKAGRRVARPNPSQRVDAWERQVGGFKLRMEKVVNRLTQINLDLRSGDILIAPEVLRSAPAEELEELRQWLTPEAIRKYQNLDPKFFANQSGVVQPSEDLRIAMTQPGSCHACSLFAEPPPPTLFDHVSELFAPRADAAIAATCVAACANPAVCPACLAAALGVGAFLVVQVENGLEACDRFGKARRAVCKAGVILGFLVTIA